MKTPNDIHITSWEHFNTEIFREAWSEQLERFRSPFAFRGVPDYRYNLKTSLIWLGGPYRELEPVILRNFKKYAYQDASPGKSVWNWLAVAQHHGLPTRLLDWSNSPYVALHFVTADLDKYEVDGAIWCVDLMKIRDQVPPELKRMLQEEFAILFNVDMLGRLAGSLEKFDKLAKEPFVLFLDPPALDERIINQFALFSMMSSPTAQMDDWLLQNPGYFFRIIIPAEMKWEMRDKLDQINMTERVLFPGLDGLSSWLTRYYSPRNWSKGQE